MRALSVIAAILSLPLLALGSAESENEPAKEQMDILARAVAGLNASSIPELTSRFNAQEETGYYLREARLLGRFPTDAGYRSVFRVQFVRSSPYREGAVTPPRGHTFVVLFDDKLSYLEHARIEFDDQLNVHDGEVTVDGNTVMRLSSKKIE